MYVYMYVSLNFRIDMKKSKNTDEQHQRLNDLMNELIKMSGLSKKEFAERNEIKDATLNSWMKGTRTIQTRDLQHIFNINPNYIENGELPKLLKPFHTPNADPVETPKEVVREIEFITVPANMGLDYTFSDIAETSYVKDVKKSYKPTYKQVRVTGNSMHPSIRNGWRVTFDSNIHPSEDDVVVATVDGILVVKRYKIINGVKTLISVNPDYQHYHFNGGDNVKIHGVVIEFSAF